jgi:hypothetical protein
MPTASSTQDEPTVAELCGSLDRFIGTEFQIDLSGEVVERQISNAGYCVGPDGGVPACCNWTWIAYALPCAKFDIVLTGSAAPYGSEVIAPHMLDDDFERVPVTLGCQGPDCEPTCTPSSVSDIGRVRARLIESEDGTVTVGEQFEPFDAQAALDILEAL